jgi:hypothetical protein
VKVSAAPPAEQPAPLEVAAAETSVRLSRKAPNVRARRAVARDANQVGLTENDIDSSH